MEENSGVKFQEAFVALGRQWVGNIEDSADAPKDMVVVLPSSETTTEQSVQGTKNDLKTEVVSLPSTVDEAVKIIERFESGARGLRDDDPVSDNVVQHMLNDRTGLLDEGWLGTEEEEKFSYVSELLYIHSKVMIVDDRRVIVSNNLISPRSSYPLELYFDRWVLLISMIAVRRQVFRSFFRCRIWLLTKVTG